MAWYAQTNYKDKQGINGRYTISEIGCFVTSFCNLLRRFGREIAPPDMNRVFTQRAIYIDVDDGIRDDLGWNSITAYNGQVQVEQVGGAGWPPHSNAIVKFHYRSQRTGQMVTHFCLVADHGAGTIIDSWDGQIKKPGIYGTPVAWATYKNVMPEPVVPRPQPQSPAAPALPAAPILTTPAKPVETGPQITYEILAQPRKMHTNKPANRYGFGNAKTWADFKNAIIDTRPANSNVEIVAIAHHPVPPRGADYYMERLAFGDYVQTGRVAQTIGFSWADLTDGWYEEPKPAAPEAPVLEQPKPETPVVMPTAPVNTEPTVPEITPPKPAPTADVVTVPVSTNKPGQATTWQRNRNQFKTTYRGIQQEAYVVRRDMTVKDHADVRPDKRVEANQHIPISGVFEKDGIMYARPTQSVIHGHWFGIPLSNLISESELYDTRRNMAERVATGNSLDLQEFFALQISRVRSGIRKLLENNKK